MHGFGECRCFKDRECNACRVRECELLLNRRSREKYECSYSGTVGSLDRESVKISKKWEAFFSPQKVCCGFDLEHRILRGVPVFLKRRVWKKIVYRKTRHDYSALKKKECGYEYQIDMDIQRTLRAHPTYSTPYGRAQCELFHVLVAYANANPVTGYCQGMSNFTAIFLMFFSEEETFHVLASLLEENKIFHLFDKTLSKLPRIISIQRKLLYAFSPSTIHRIEKEEIDLSSFMCSWYLTLFSRFNLEFVLRIYDLLIFYGFPILFLVGCAILNFHKKKIQTLKKENLLEFLSNLENEEIRISEIIRSVRLYNHLIDIDVIKKMINK